MEGKKFINTKFNGVKFTYPFSKAIFYNVDFTGSEGAVVDLRNLSYQEFIPTINFTDAEKVIGYNGEDMNILENGQIEKTIENKLDKILIKKNLHKS